MTESDSRPDEVFDDLRELFLEHYRHPKNRRVLAGPDAIGSAQAASGAVLTIYLGLGRSGTDNEARIARIGFQSQRCGVAVAYASLLTELVLGQSLTQARNLRPEDLMNRFGKGAGALESAALAIDALRRALRSVEQ